MSRDLSGITPAHVSSCPRRMQTLDRHYPLRSPSWRRGRTVCDWTGHSANRALCRFPVQESHGCPERSADPPRLRDNFRLNQRSRNQSSRSGRIDLSVKSMRLRVEVRNNVRSH
jgi:hypothetical protein